MKNIIKLPLVLGCISSISALLISGIFILTSKTIEENEQQAEIDGLNNIYEGATFEKLEDYTFEDDSPLIYVYKATMNSSTVGFVYKGTGSNAYGHITLLTGINNDTLGSVEDVYLLENDQSYASTIDKWVSDTDFSDPENIDVHCGATKGATVIQDIVVSARNDFLEKGFDYE